MNDVYFIFIFRDRQSENGESKKTEWTEAHLMVPEALLEIDDQIITDPPVPPPRKHKFKKEVKIKVAKLEKDIMVGAAPEPYKNLVPIEEPIIVPKKEPVHICDGTHSHAINYCHNGGVLHKPKESNVGLLTQEKNQSLLMKPKTKNHSTVSLPNVDELKNNMKASKVDAKPEKKPTRNISVISLPTETKVTLSDETAARVENYMSCCKSFTDLAPKELLEKLQSADQQSDSEESWDGINEWEIESVGKSLKSPFQPKSRLETPRVLMKPQTVAEEPQTAHAKEAFKGRTERRESIDDFFDSKANVPYVVSEEEETEAAPEPKIYLGRRGSDSFFTETYKPEHNTHKSNVFFSNALLESESITYAPIEVLSTKVEAEEPKETLNTLEGFIDKKKGEHKNDVTHSNLLKIIQENSFQEKDEECDKYKIPEPLRSALLDVNERISEIDQAKKADH